MKSATLDELCEINVGRTPARAEPSYWGPGHRWLSIADMNQGLSITATKEQITDAGAKAGKVVKPGTVLLSFKLSIGKVGIAKTPLYTNEAIAALPVKDEKVLDTRYLMRALEAMNLADGSNRAAMGATLNKKSLAQIRVPLPPLPEQRRIAAILDHADALRIQRSQVLTRLDSLTQSIFHDLFGDLHSGTWAKVLFADVVPKVDNGSSPNCEARPASKDEWGVLKLGAVTYGYFQANENKAYLGDLGRMTANEVKPGDVLMTRKNTRELVGAVALVDQVRPQLLLPDLIFRLHLDTGRVDRRYFHALMMNPQKRPAVRDLSSGSASSMPNISKARLSKLPLELPPLSLQKQFASKVESVEALRAKTLNASATDDVLFASLQSRAFRGEL